MKKDTINLTIIDDTVLKQLKHYKKVQLDNMFKDSIDILADYNITHLDLGPVYYNEPINKLPLTLIYLKLSLHYTHKLPQLPPKLVSLCLGWFYDHELLDLPETLRELTIGFRYSYKLPDLPLYLKSLTLNCKINEPLDFLPPQLEYLFIDDYKYILDNLPNSLLTLKLCDYKLSLDMIPDSITTLDIKNYKNKINKLPANIKDLQMYKRNPDYDVLKEKFRKEKLMVIENSGFDEYYLMKLESINDEGLDFDDIEIRSNTTRSIVSSFTKFSKNRLESRVVLNRFINLIS